MDKTSIAITGLGIFCAAGKDLASFTDALLHGRSGIGPVDIFDVSPFPSHIGAQVRDYSPWTTLTGPTPGGFPAPTSSPPLQRRRPLA